ncbi:phosphatidylglycerophosphatase [Sporobolomyces koalae]|uniref:phosphatidylglycerophosphatase n=1 Tax=Sporobolomyces koalae TaxID=500713 RepID=UPI00316BC043
MTNWAGISASLSALVRPTIVQPRLTVHSIANLDFAAFKQRGVTGVVIDKDNCITIPHDDRLPRDNLALHAAWRDLLDTFGPENVLIVSNSVGTVPKDPALLGAEAVSRNLKVPVLVHAQPKPSHRCVTQIANHFDRLSTPTSNAPAPTPAAEIVWSPLARSARTRRPRPNFLPCNEHDLVRILVIGDRLATDMILSHRLAKVTIPLPLSFPKASLWVRLFRRPKVSGNDRAPRRIETVGILTTDLHAKEGLGTRFLRMTETLALQRLNKQRTRLGLEWHGEPWERCLKGYTAAAATPRLKPASEIVTKPDSQVAVIRNASNGSTATSSRSSTFLLSSLSSLSALPHTVPHFFRRLPTSTLQALKRAPVALYGSLVRGASSAFDHLIEFLPTVASRLHAPLERFTTIYTRPQELTGIRRPVDQAREVDGKTGQATLERAIDRVERVVIQARDRVARKKALSEQ